MANRVAWVLSTILTVALVAGIGVAVRRGVTLGAVTVQVAPTGRWNTRGADATVETPSTTTQVFNRGFFAVVITRPRKQ
jgi:hypothetical protein